MCIIRCYLALDNTLTIDSVITALKERSWVSELLVAGDLNANLDKPEGYWREEEIAPALKTVGLEEILSHFFPQRRPQCPGNPNPTTH